jgi:HSP20 family protein
MAQPVRDRSTSVARPDPFAEYERLHSEFTRLFEGEGQLPSLLRDGFLPLADVEETEDGYTIELELPGIKKEDIDISLAGRRLTVSGERKEKERKGVLRRRTRSVGRFYFEVTLPGDVDESGVTASLDQGVLTMRVPKANADRPRHIEVN